MPVLENAIDDLVEEFDKALKYDYVISSPIVYALHQVLMKYEKLESKYIHEWGETTCHLNHTEK